MPMSVTDVIERLRAQGDVAKAGFHLEYDRPKPLPAEAIAALELPGGGAVPDDLAEWLRYAGSWIPVLKKDKRTWRGKPLRKLLAKWLEDMRESDDEDVEEELEEIVEIVGDDVLGYWLSILPDKKLADVHAIEIPSAGDQENILMLEPGRNTLRVLGCHKRIEFWWKYPTFAGYLAHHFGFEDPS